MARFSFVAAAIIAMAVTAFSGFLLIPWLQKLKYGQTINDIGPTWHKNKEGTPTMGGLMFIFGSLIGTAAGFGLLLWSIPELSSPEYLQMNLNLLIGVLTALAFGVIGFLDDYIKVVKKQNLGLTAVQKIIMQIAVAAAFLASLYLNGGLSTVISIPFLGDIRFGIFYYLLSFILIIGIVNGVNLTDGIDGLNTSVTFVVSLGFMVFASLLGIYNMSIFAAALAGGCAGFLLWNFYPAKVIMGDTGAMYLGGALVALAYGIGRPEVLLIAGFVYVVEAASVIIQRVYFKLTHGKRIFKMSPIHHHFEMSGWSEVKIDIVFSLVAVLSVILAALHIYLF